MEFTFNEKNEVTIQNASLNDLQQFIRFVGTFQNNKPAVQIPVSPEVIPIHNVEDTKSVDTVKEDVSIVPPVSKHTTKQMITDELSHLQNYSNYKNYCSATKLAEFLGLNYQTVKEYANTYNIHTKSDKAHFFMHVLETVHPALFYHAEDIREDVRNHVRVIKKYVRPVKQTKSTTSHSTTSQKRTQYDVYTKAKILNELSTLSAFSDINALADRYGVKRNTMLTWYERFIRQGMVLLDENGKILFQVKSNPTTEENPVNRDEAYEEWANKLSAKVKQYKLNINDTYRAIYKKLHNVYGIVWDELSKQFYHFHGYKAQSTLRAIYFLEYEMEHESNVSYKMLFENLLEEHLKLFS